jgi:predicted phage-related endonuclease
MAILVYRPRDPEFAEPGSPEHNRLITASKAAAIVGVSRWHSAYSTWLEMKGLIEPEPAKSIFDTGKAMELALAELWKLRHPGCQLSPTHVQFVTDDYGFDAAVTPDRVARGRGRKLVEFKITNDWEEWGDVETPGDAPTDYVVQNIFQMGISGVRRPLDLMVMGPWFSEKCYTIEWDETVWNWIVSVCRRFWSSLDSDEPPELDDSVATYAAVRARHPDIEPGLSVDIPESLGQDYVTAHAEASMAEAVLRGLKSKILAEAKNAQYIRCNGSVIAARQPHYRGGVSLVPRFDSGAT